jgi:hypothetical protein
VSEQAQRHILATGAVVVVEEQQILHDGTHLPQVALDGLVLLVPDDGYGGLVRLDIVRGQYKVFYSVV